MGTWLANLPTQARIDFWRGKAQGGHKVAIWPHPNTPRIDPRFRMKYVVQPTFPVASRWGFYFQEFGEAWDPDDPNNNGFGWFDMTVIDVDHIAGSLPLNALGYAAEILFRVDENMPLHQQAGIICEIDLTIPGEPLQKQTGEFVAVGEGLPLRYDEDTKEHGPSPGWNWVDLDPFVDDVLICQLFAASECYLFPEEPVGQAAFNGTDAYVKLANLMTFTNNPFRLSVELKLNQTVNHWPIFGRDGTGGFFGMRGADIIFGTLTLPTTWVPVQDVWFTWVYEFEPVTQLQHKLTIAGTVVRDSTNGRQFTPMDTIGVYRHGVSGTLWADMDMRNLKLETGTPGNYVTKLDMPLMANALDSGPEANHGTTFNMPLPSV